MKLTTMGERRIRGDLIKTFKIVNGIVDCGKNIFRLSRFNRNIMIRKTNVNFNAKNSAIICKLRS